jgi:hypothetical protein
MKQNAFSVDVVLLCNCRRKKRFTLDQTEQTREVESIRNPDKLRAWDMYQHVGIPHFLSDLRDVAE